MNRLRCLLILFVMASCSRQTTPVKIDAGLAKMVPQDATLLAGVRIDELRSTPLWKRLVEKEAGRMGQFIQGTMLDPRKDVDELLAASNGQTTVVFARGRFPVSDIETRLLGEGGRKFTYRGHHLTGRDDAAVAFLDAGLAAAGPVAALQAAIDRRSGFGGGLPSGLVEKLHSVPAQSQAWAVASGMGPLLKSGAVPESGNLSNLRRMLEAVDSATVGLDLRAGVSLDSTAACRSQQDAKLIHDSLRGLIGMGRLTTPDNQPDLLRLYDAFQVVQDKSSVRVTAAISTDLLNKFLDDMEKRAGGMAP